ncbi:MAG: hypothetical protein AAGC47_07825 [Bacteroidota bacterium]
MKTIATFSFLSALFISINAPCQDLAKTAEAFEACLNKTEVKPFLRPVQLENEEEVIPFITEFESAEFPEMSSFRIPLFHSAKPDLFFHGIEDYVHFNSAIREDHQILVSLFIKQPILCIYNLNLEKVEEVVFNYR